MVKGTHMVGNTKIEIINGDISTLRLDYSGPNTTLLLRDVVIKMRTNANAPLDVDIKHKYVETKVGFELEGSTFKGDLKIEGNYVNTKVVENKENEVEFKADGVALTLESLFLSMFKASFGWARRKFCCCQNSTRCNGQVIQQFTVQRYQSHKEGKNKRFLLIDMQSNEQFTWYST
eukprot:TRINITY_DN7558_c0_g2_i2.p1 TRINITY_DN7558_c0_g2~~TRINITY_DN7558_c0_g2_i2.p1  ORF type:complete len:176 (+),score=31.67 TRINITY_DN7558_c0_g2_i2:143-670(+)